MLPFDIDFASLSTPSVPFWSISNPKIWPLNLVCTLMLLAPVFDVDSTACPTLKVDKAQTEQRRAAVIRPWYTSFLRFIADSPYGQALPRYAICHRACVRDLSKFSSQAHFIVANLNCLWRISRARGSGPCERPVVLSIRRDLTVQFGNCPNTALYSSSFH